MEGFMHKCLFCVISIVLLFNFQSCKGDSEKVTSQNEWNDSTSIGFNKDRVKEEELQINLYLSHHSDLKLKPSGTGLRYQIIKKTEGNRAESGDSVDVEMKISLLDGKVCYQTDSLELDQFLIDRSQVESGIQEGIKLMKEGERAVFILPSNLAHGLLGDFETIPPMSPIVVNLELIKVIKNKTN
jgi:FKBP-type peptidyl-prolyl cis-trans isomerase